MKRLALLLIPLLLLTSCAERITRTEFIMDTVITYDVTSKHGDVHVEHTVDVVKSLEAELSAHIEDSTVSRFNRGERVEISSAAYTMIQIANEVSEATDGAYDITVAPLVSLWNVTGENFVPPSDGEIAALLPFVGYGKLTVEKVTVTENGSDATKFYLSAPEGTMIDLGGIAKGYACGFTESFLEAKGHEGTLNFGGNVAVMGEKKDGWNVGIKNPAEPDTIIGVLNIDSGIVAVSGGYERYGEFESKRYHHIIDPKTGYPAESDLASAAVWVKGGGNGEGALADALSTALFVMGSERSLELYRSQKFEFEAILIKNDGTVITTDGIGDSFTKK